MCCKFVANIFFVAKKMLNMAFLLQASNHILKYSILNF